MTKTINFYFNIIIVFLLGLFIGFFLGAHPVYASNYQYGDSENDFNDRVNTLTEFTTMNKILSDTKFIDSKNYISNFKNKYNCDQVYFISYYNSGVDNSGIYRSGDLYCLPSTINFEPIVSLDDKSIQIHLSGPAGESFVRRGNEYISSYLETPVLNDYGYFDYNYRGKYVVRSIFDITNYYDFDQELPNYFLSSSFQKTNFIQNIFNSTNSFGFYIALMISLFIFLYIIDKKLGLGIGFNYRGGAL